MGRTTDENGEAGLAIEAKTDQCEGGGTGHWKSFHRQALSPREDSRLNLSRIGLRPSLGGDVTTLTPFFLFSLDEHLGGLPPEPILAYCTVTDISSPDSCPNSWAIPDMMADIAKSLPSLHST